MRWRGRTVPLAVAAVAACGGTGLRKFPDRPVAWEEHDDAHVTGEIEHHGEYPFTWSFRDAFVRSLDRTLSLPVATPA
jgi:hypothetical protein